jgi:hypothetical protein
LDFVFYLTLFWFLGVVGMEPMAYAHQVSALSPNRALF